MALNHIVAYSCLVHPSKVALDFIFSNRLESTLSPAAAQAAVIYGITKEQAIEEFRRFLALSVFASHKMAIELNPTPLMYYMSQATVLDESFYAELQATLKIEMPNKLEEIRDQRERDMGIEMIVDIYKTNFEVNLYSCPSTKVVEKPIDDVNTTAALRQSRQAYSIIASASSREIVGFNIRKPDGQLVNFRARHGTGVAALIQWASHSLDVEADTIRLHHHGFRMWSRKTLGMCRVENGDSLDLSFVA
ncbi:hypothetical protein VTL71DRAFT_13311 [Oculimacula yallundae]|uniref:Uncharacterized protein n=1 Tax=Oculimacula yallundae TaxID=86028 RepID=A0ABR4CKH5_9HELO